MSSNCRQYTLLVLLMFIASFSLTAQSTTSNLSRNFVEKNYKNFNLTQKDVQGSIISSEHTSSISGIHYVYFNQALDGVPVHNAIMNIASKNGKIFNHNHTYVVDIASKVESTRPSLSSKEAVLAAASHLGLSVSNLALSNEHTGREANKYLFNTGGISKEDIPVKLVIVRENKGKTASLAWEVVISEKRSSDWWTVFINANTGRFIKKDNLTIYCNFSEKDHVHNDYCKAEVRRSPAQSKKYQTPPSPIVPRSHARMSNQYLVFDYPLESPLHGNISLVENPYEKFAPTGTGPGATNGWHHTENVNYLQTRGNNVWSREDLNDTDSGGNDVDGGVDLVFSPFYDEYGSHADNLDASIVNIFYWSNVLHDILYVYGFDEASGNFQDTNLDRGGVDGDFLFADAQDGSGTNNANFGTPSDGGNPRMQMFIWSSYASDDSEVTIDSPAGIAGSYIFRSADFSSTVAMVSGELILALDADGTTSIACPETLPFQNEADLDGKIVMIDRGDCRFDEKAPAVEATGAIAVVVCNNEGGGVAPGMTGEVAVGIPVISFSKEDCDLIKIELQSSTIELTIDIKQINPDSGFDNGIIAHEYGHGWSTRLTGGANNSSCLNGEEQQGEGWSDYLTLMLTTNWSTLSPTPTDANKLRGIGNYSAGGGIDGPGIRAVPYSYDFSTNNTAVYDNLEDFSIPHGIGTVWCTILWDMTWEIILFDDFIQHDIWDTSVQKGNIAAMMLVSEGLKLQPCSPTFVTSRDAILAADQALFDGRYRCKIWEIFAKRGVGAGAVSGGTSLSDNVADYTIPDGLDIITSADAARYDVGDMVTVSIEATCGCQNQAGVSIKEIVPEGFTIEPASTTGLVSNDTITWDNLSFNPNETRTFSYTATVNDTADDSEVALLVDDSIDNNASLPGDWRLSGNWGIKGSPSSQVCDGRGYFARDFDFSSDNSIVLNINTSGKDLTIFFDHRYDTEANYDGGVVEVSNDGKNWVDMGDYFVENGYNSFSSTVGRNMFSGNSGSECISSVIEFDELCGPLQIRFRMLTDPAVGGVGWLIDNVRVFSVDGIKTDTKAYDSDGNLLDNSCACSIIGDAQTTPTNEIADRSSDVKLFPNPASSSFLIQTNGFENEDYEMSILSIDGRVINAQTLNGNNLNDGFAIDASGFSAGVYFVQLKGSNFNAVQKLIIK